MEFTTYQFVFVTLILFFNAVPEGQTQDSRSACWLVYSFGVCITANECSNGGSSSLCNAEQLCCPYNNIHTTTTSPPNTDQTETGNEFCGRRHPNGIDMSRMGGLEISHFAEFPWTVAVLSDKPEDKGEWNYNTLQGAGSLIGEHAVLTAAHIIYGMQGVPLKVRAGEGHIKEVEIVDYVESPVQAVIFHEEFNNVTLANDIALLILKDPIKIDIHIGFACLPEQGQRAPVGEKCYATGWGTDKLDGVPQNNMKRTKLPIVARPDCIRTLRRSRLGPFYMLPSSNICAGGKTEEDTCLGDGGSPLVCKMPEAEFYYSQFGITSWGVDCGDETPGAYTNVAAFRQWIDEKITANELPNSTYVLKKGHTN